MVHIERAWQRNLVGKATLILIGLLLLVIVVGIPVSVIILLTSPGRQSAEAPPSAQAANIAPITPTLTLIASPTPQPTALPQPSPSPTPTTAMSLAVQLTITETNDFVNIRSGPGLTYTVVTHLNKGQTATVVGRNADSSWWLIEINAVRGWV